MRPFWYFNVSVWSGEKSFSFQGYAKIVCWLHIARTENPDTPQTHPSASNFHEYHTEHPPDIPQTTLRHLQGTWHAKKRQQTPTDTARHPKTLPCAVWVCLAVSFGASCSLLLSVGMSCSLDMSGAVWGMSGAFLRVSEWYLWKLEALRCVWGV